MKEDLAHCCPQNDTRRLCWLELAVGGAAAHQAAQPGDTEAETDEDAVGSSVLITIITMMNCF